MASFMAKLSKTYSNTEISPTFVLCTVGIMFILGFISILTAKTPTRSDVLVRNAGKTLKALTWNMAAINNNPFEYWITSEDPAYNELMRHVSDFISVPSAEKDVNVSQVFTDAMFDELSAKMRGIGWSGVDEVKVRWDSDYKHRKIISGFIKDKAIGKKRLASMPDRYTNTISTLDQGIVTRPTVINCYEGDLGSMQKWWAQWSDFVFEKKITIKKKETSKTVHVYQLMAPILKAKYPDITIEEEAISIPLQTLCLAVFDSILVHMLNQVSPNHWQRIRADICNSLNKKKTETSLSILEDHYTDCDIAFLQEVSANFKSQGVGRKISESFDVLSPSNMDSDRDQNSFIMLKKGRFTEIKDETAEIEFPPGEKVPIALGDLFVMSAVDILDGHRYLLASFHGDTNGLATIPVVSAVHAFATTKRKAHKLIFGMDANTYGKPESDQQGVTAFAEFFTSKNMNSCYGQHPDPASYTTFCARTHLQPQLNKAASIHERDVKGDKNPKDFIIFYDSDFSVASVAKDNTGVGAFKDEMVFPTLSFPSDHAITSTVLVESR